MSKLLTLLSVPFLFSSALSEEVIPTKKEQKPRSERPSRFMVFPHDLEFTYKTVGESELKCMVYNPEGHDPTAAQVPAIVLFFGGAWRGGSVDQASAFCNYFAKHGLVAIAADYRVKNRGAASPKDCVKDGKSAIRWVKANHKKLGIDPDKVIAGGFSAGGHVAATTGTGVLLEDEQDDLSISARPAALVLYNPVYDNSAQGYGHEVVKDYWKEISPRHNLDSQTPPTIVFLGDDDKHISPEIAQSYQQAMHDLGLRSDLHLYKGGKHGFMNLPGNGRGNKYFGITASASVDFLRSLDLIPPTAK